MISTVGELTGVERFFDREEVIVSKTDLKGVITYANRVFQRVSGYNEVELIGKPHNLIRHPDMPRCVFKLLWDMLGARDEVFAYVLNRCRNGDHYWVFAHVTPSLNAHGTVVGYHSNRRVPSRDAVRKAESLYAELLVIENSYANRREGMEAAERALVERLETAGMTYDEFVFSL